MLKCPYCGSTAYRLELDLNTPPLIEAGDSQFTEHSAMTVVRDVLQVLPERRAKAQFPWFPRYFDILAKGQADFWSISIPLFLMLIAALTSRSS